MESQARPFPVVESTSVFCVVYVRANSVGCEYRETKIFFLKVY